MIKDDTGCEPAVDSTPLIDFPRDPPTDDYFAVRIDLSPKTERWSHSETHEIGEQESGWPNGDIITIECRSCGEHWREELPR